MARKRFLTRVRDSALGAATEALYAVFLVVLCFFIYAAIFLLMGK